MNDNVNEKLDHILNKIKFLTNAYEVIHNYITITNPTNLNKLGDFYNDQFKKLTTAINDDIMEIRSCFRNKLSYKIENEDILEFKGMIKFIAKRLDEIERRIFKIESENTKKIRLSFDIDGYEYEKGKKSPCKTLGLPKKQKK